LCPYYSKAAGAIAAAAPLLAYSVLDEHWTMLASAQLLDLR